MEDVAGTVIVRSGKVEANSEPASPNPEQSTNLAANSMRSTLIRWRHLIGVLNRFGHIHRYWLFQGLGAAVGVTLLRLALPWPLQALLLPVLSGDGAPPPAWIPTDMNSMLVAGALFALCLAAIGFVDARARFSFAVYAIGTLRDFRKEVIRTLYKRSQPRKPVRSGDVVARLIGDTARVKAGLKGFLIHVAVNGLLLLGITCVMIYIDTTIGAMFGLCILGVSLVALIGAKKIYETAAKYRRNEGRLANDIVKVAKFAKLEQPSKKRRKKIPKQLVAGYKKTNRSSGRKEAHITKLTGYSTWAAHSLLGLFGLAAIYYGIQALDAGTLSTGNLLLFALYVLTARTPIVQVARQGVRTGKILACLGRLEEFLEHPKVDTGNTSNQ